MPAVMQSPDRAVFRGTARPAEHGGGPSRVEPGTMFVKSSLLSTLASYLRSDAKPYGDWMMLTTVEREAVEQELVEAGSLVCLDAFIEASAFGCDSKVLERAVNRVETPYRTLLAMEWT
jgi:hypothetical protein